MIRIFKDESELEVWVQKEERFELFAVYPFATGRARWGPS